MKKLSLLLLFPVICYGQGDQTIINVPINSTGSSSFQAILHLPNDYGTTTTAYPLLVFLHGLGEGGANPASIYTSSTAGGPAYFIAQGTFPASFVNPKDGKSYKYIVVSPQANPQGVEGSTTAQELDYVLTYLYAHYRVDTSRVYLTGLSDGGESVVEYIGGEMTNGGNLTLFHRTHNVAAIVPMSENASAGLMQQEADSIVSENLGAWGFGSTDAQGQNTLSIAWYANVKKAGSMITTSYSGGHCCWGQFYDPSFTQNGMSIYQWMLQFTHGVSVSAQVLTTTPTASAGTAQTVQLPTSQTTLSGAASTVTNGTIAAYSWSQKSGPSSAVIASPAAASTSVTGLVAGVYVFNLTITDNTGKTSSATVQVTVNAAVVTTTTPTANAGTAQTVQLPTSQAILSGAASTVTNGTIAAYSWSQKSGPSSAVIASPAAASTSVTGLVAGVYVFNLTITDNTGKTSSATVQVTVNAAIPAGQSPIPGKILASGYKTSAGVMTQLTSDTGGGYNVGWINQGDWMDYPVYVTAAGSYTVSFRVATPSTGASFQLRTGAGAVLATIQAPNTGGWQNWVTVSAKATLAAGSQTLQLYSTSAAGWNVNWMQFSTGTQGTQAVAGQAFESDSAFVVPASVATEVFMLYPNPAKSSFTVQVSNSLAGAMTIQVIDATGRVRQAQVLHKDQSPVQVSLSAESLPAGIYFVRVQVGTWSEVRKLMKY